MNKDKKRSAPALDAWARHGGAHSGARRPEGDDTEEGLEEFLLDVCGTIEIDGETYEIEFCLDDGEGDDDDGEE